jgi:hypothetical protein
MRFNRMLAITLALLPLSALAASGDGIHALRQEIAALQADRALNLTADQARTLLPILQGAAADAQSRRAATKSALTAALTQARDDLRAGGAISPATQQALVAARKDAWSGMQQQNQLLRQQVTQVLTPEQVQALRQARFGMGPAWSNSQKGKGRGAAHRMASMRTLTSDAFLALLQARAA